MATKIKTMCHMWQKVIMRGPRVLLSRRGPNVNILLLLLLHILILVLEEEEEAVEEEEEDVEEEDFDLLRQSFRPCPLQACRRHLLDPLALGVTL